MYRGRSVEKGSVAIRAPISLGFQPYTWQGYTFCCGFLCGIQFAVSVTFLWLLFQWFSHSWQCAVLHVTCGVESSARSTSRAVLSGNHFLLGQQFQFAAVVTVELALSLSFARCVLFCSYLLRGHCHLPFGLRYQFRTICHRWLWLKNGMVWL